MAQLQLTNTGWQYHTTMTPAGTQWGWWLRAAVACRYLLPPVIFYCGLSVEKSRFFIALPSILMYGVFGTLASFIIISVFMYLTLGFAMFKMEVGLGPKLLITAADAAPML